MTAPVIYDLTAVSLGRHVRSSPAPGTRTSFNVSRHA